MESKIPFKALCYREVMLARTVELAKSAVDGLTKKRLVVASTLTRSAMESMAKAHELQRLLDGFVLAPDIRKLDESLMTLLFGSRNNSDLPTPTSILTAVDKTEKLIPGFRGNYDRLSELTHPNYLGGMGAFTTVDRVNHRVEFSKLERKLPALEMTANILIGTLDGFTVFYKHVGETIEMIHTMFENGLIGAGQNAN